MDIVIKRYSTYVVIITTRTRLTRVYANSKSSITMDQRAKNCCLFQDQTVSTIKILEKHVVGGAI